MGHRSREQYSVVSIVSLLLFLKLCFWEGERSREGQKLLRVPLPPLAKLENQPTGDPVQGEN